MDNNHTRRSRHYPAYPNRDGKYFGTVGSHGTKAIKQRIDRHINKYVEITPKEGGPGYILGLPL